MASNIQPAFGFPAAVENMTIGRFKAAPNAQSMREFETGIKADDQVIDAVLGILANDPRVLNNDITIHGLSTLRQIRDDTTPTSQAIRDSLRKTNKEVFPWVAHETHGVCLVLDYACQTISILDPHPDAHGDQACEIHDDMQRTLSKLNMTLGIGQQAIVRDGFPQHENDCGVYMLGWVEALLSRQSQLGDLGGGDHTLLTLRARYTRFVLAEVMSQMLRQGALNASQAGADEVMMGMDEASEDGQGDG